uniref:Uncharacterized protein n=1 Tax=Ganoderma boninense TaxID=34458 RepID=A0A5K1JRT1_9APHY|nr:Uncharacterized protein [Ganoderma boninense]
MNILELFSAAMVGSYSETAVNNYVSGLQAWHVLHGLPWDIDKPRFKVMLRAANRLAPTSRGKRPPLTVDIITILRSGLDLDAPLDAAVWAALLTVFWCTARRGEFILKTLASFDPDLHVQRSHYRTEPELPTCDPLPALHNHFNINNPEDDCPLFSYKHKGSIRPLTGHAMQKRLKAVAAITGVDLPPGHSARIGSLLWHLLNGMPFMEAMAKGRWQSVSSFHLYLRQHAQVLSPHLQARPHLYSELNRRILDASQSSAAPSVR